MLQDLEVVPSSESRTELIAWLNSSMPTTAPNGNAVPPIRKVEQCCSGVPYVLLLPQVLPVTYAPLSSTTRVKVPANHEFEAVANYKLVQDALHRNGVLKPDVLLNDQTKLLKGNFQANLQLLQWFKGFVEALAERGVEPGQGRRQPGLDGTQRSSENPAEELLQRSGDHSDGAGAAAAAAAAPPTDEGSATKKAKVPPVPLFRSRATAQPRASGTPVKVRSGSAGPSSRVTVGAPARTSTPSRPRPSTATTAARAAAATRGRPASPGPSRPARPPSPAPGRPARVPLSRPPSAATGSRGLSSSVRAGSVAVAASGTVAAEDLARAQQERQFFYDKLRMIENLVAKVAEQEPTQENVATIALARSVRDVLYAHN